MASLRRNRPGQPPQGKVPLTKRPRWGDDEEVFMSRYVVLNFQTGRSWEVTGPVAWLVQNLDPDLLPTHQYATKEPRPASSLSLATGPGLMPPRTTGVG